MLTIEYQNSFDDILALNLYNHQHSATLRRQNLISRLIVTSSFPLSLLACYLLFSGGRMHPLAKLLLVLVGLAGAVAIFFLYGLYLRRRVVRLTRKLYAEAKNKAIADRRSLTIEPGGIASHSDLSDARVQWPAIERIIATPTHLFLYVGAMNAIVIPRAAFGSAQQAEEFVRQAEQYRSAAGAG